jgi:glycosyltransferase involved in cell wall biosynthesis
MRIIFVPQYPTKMRYQEWWWKKLPEEFEKRSFDVITLGETYLKNMKHKDSVDMRLFSPINSAIELESEQIKEYMNLELRDDDILFLADISFPGLFSNVLFHKRCKKMFAFCHATSLNRYDYFSSDVHCKFPIETMHSCLFDTIFIGSEYHKNKLINGGEDFFESTTHWQNTKISYLPFPPLSPSKITQKKYNIISVSRPTKQKVDMNIEMEIYRKTGEVINRPLSESWEEYFDNLAMSKVLLITAHEDTFGYQIVDAIMNGCIPLARRSFAYPELLPDEYLYDDTEELLEKLDKFLKLDEIGPKVPNLICREQMNKFYDILCEEMKKDI